MGQVQQQLHELRAALAAARIDARKGLLGQRRLQATMDRLAEAVLPPPRGSGPGEEPPVPGDPGRGVAVGRGSMRARGSAGAVGPARAGPADGRGGRLGNIDPGPWGSDDAGPGRVRPGKGEGLGLEDETASAQRLRQERAARAGASGGRHRLVDAGGGVGKTEGAAMMAAGEWHGGGASHLDLNRLDVRLDGLEAQLSKVSKGAKGAGELSAGDDNEDRKRLKEKLSKALQRVRSDTDRRCLNWCAHICYDVTTVFFRCCPDLIVAFISISIRRGC